MSNSKGTLTMSEQEKAFWDVIEAFNQVGLLSHVMIIGSWAEYIYKKFLSLDFTLDLRTRDIDFFYRNINKPHEKLKIIDALEEKGFVYSEDIISGVGKFFLRDCIEVEFITRMLGKGQAVNKIPSLGVKAESLREVNMLTNYSLELKCDGYSLIVPEPEIYALQKLYANKTRKPIFKKEKDIRSIRELLPYLNKSRLHSIFNELIKNEQKRILETIQLNYLNYLNDLFNQ